MQQIQAKISLEDTVYRNTLAALSDYDLSKICFFDIETTGLSPDISSVYLIGCGCIVSDSFEITQWFADDYVSEKDLLLSLTSYLSRFEYLFHYNGSGFDIPYLTKKYAFHKLENPFSHIESIDIYKCVKPYKARFPMPNLKLTSLEQFLNIKRRDSFSGKECIELYTDFMKHKYYQNSEKREWCKEKLLLHNFDDIVGTFLSVQILLYLRILTGNGKNTVAPSFKETEHLLTYTYTANAFYPTGFSCEGEHFSLSYDGNKCHVTMPLYKQTAYYFFSDVKNYYYLPAEDMAVHKSVGQYTDPAHREKATAKNCYTKKEGTFLLVPTHKKARALIPSDAKLFYSKDKKDCFVEWTGALPEWYLQIIV